MGTGETTGRGGSGRSAPVHGPGMGIHSVVANLLDFVQRMHGEGYSIEGDEDGGFTVRIMGTDDEAYIVMDETGQWRTYWQLDRVAGWES